jgi:twinkle protein
VEEKKRHNEIYSLGDLVDGALEAHANRHIDRGVSPGWSSLEPYYRVCKGMLCLVGGYPSHGKSTFVQAMVMNVTRSQQWVWAIYSPENSPLPRYVRILASQWLGVSLSRLTADDIRQACEELADHIYIILPKENNMHLDYILSCAEKIKQSRGQLDGVVIDPWNELLAPDRGPMNETDHISMSLSKVRRFARNMDIAFFIAAHPPKPTLAPDGSFPRLNSYSFSGSSTWRSKSDQILLVYRADYEDSVTNIDVAKCRFSDIGKVGAVDLKWDWSTSTYIQLGKDDPYEVD